VWTHVSAVMPSFNGSGTFGMSVPCSFDFSLAATKYFTALPEGDLPLCFLFGGTIFYESEERGVQVAPIPWEKEATFRLPAATWQALRDCYYPDSAWLCLQRDVFEQLDQYRSRAGMLTIDQAVERLLGAIKEPVGP
jgi:hypothetical protein